MSSTDVLSEIFRDSNYGIQLFSDEEIAGLRQNIISRTAKGQTRHYIKCLVRNREIAIKPEEIVRQLYLQRLIQHYR